MGVTTDKIIANSNIAFGTSGACGLVTDFSAEICAAFTQSFVRSTGYTFEFERVAIGIGNRPSSPQMAAACIGLLQAMGVTADYYGVLPTPADVFVSTDTEAVAQADIARWEAWSAKYQFDAIFSTDGDRPLIADEQGNWLRGDIVGLLCAKALGIGALALPVSCNTAIELSSEFSKVVRTKIGSPYVIAAFEQLQGSGSIAGFEANGGFLLGTDTSFAGKTLYALLTRYALLSVLALLELSGSQSLSSYSK
ncbi:hypothetical protein [Marinomonas shanghaiensis]|uniref:hypothetical protein n=1 Tax=Marinomonas shanghaiensis TaxID=2202418 RepID=UPI003A94F674